MWLKSYDFRGGLRAALESFIYNIPNAFLKSNSGLYFTIGVLGSRFPLDSLRRTLPLLWDLFVNRGALPRWLSDSEQF